VQVLGNLLTNAIKFTEPGGRVTLRAWQQKGALHIQVTDTGIGIPEQDLPHVFDKFYRVRSEQRPQGTGLGLAIAREVVEAHGGRISVSSTLGRGTTIHVVLPQTAWR
jgi:signal transduction histidine kinase